MRKYFKLKAETEETNVNLFTSETKTLKFQKVVESVILYNNL